MEKRIEFESGIIGTIEHIGIIVPDVIRLKERLISEMKVEKIALEENAGGMMFYHGEPEEIRLNIAFSKIAGQYIEYITPISGRSCHMDFLNETGGGIHHFGLMFDSVEKKERAAAFLRNANCEEVHRAQGITSSPEDQLYIFDARGLLGTFVELMTPVPFDDMPPARKVVMA